MDSWTVLRRWKKKRKKASKMYFYNFYYLVYFFNFFYLSTSLSHFPIHRFIPHSPSSVRFASFTLATIPLCCLVENVTSKCNNIIKELNSIKREHTVTWLKCFNWLYPLARQKNHVFSLFIVFFFWSFKGVFYTKYIKLMYLIYF